MKTVPRKSGLSTPAKSMLLSLRPRWSPYIPHQPTPKQTAFLMLPHMEAFYGGAAGGGKSDALLMGALQYVDIPGYAALLIRRKLTDAAQSQGILDRARQWLVGTDVTWDSGSSSFLFPTGSRISIGYLDTNNDIYRYMGSEFQYIGFDELTQFYEDWYTFLFSRLRRPACPTHGAKPHARCEDCKRIGGLSAVPLRMRAASNPGSQGHEWVKDRFEIKQVTLADGRTIYRGTHPERPHIPAFVQDNPFVDRASYTQSLNHLDPVTREQLLHGDWGISADGRFKRSWARYYSLRGDYVVLGPDGRGPMWHKNRCRIFTTVDPAASAREGPGDIQVWRKAPSWTVISTWILTPDGHLLWWDVVRKRVEIPDIMQELRTVYQNFSPEFIAIEPDGLGIGVYQLASRLGLPVRPMKHRSVDKLVQATDACNRMEQGKVWFPQRGLRPWLDTLESEIFTWTGDPYQTADQIDTLADAAILASEESCWNERVVPGDLAIPDVVH